MSKITLYTVTHKQVPIIKNDIYEPIQVGRAINQSINGFIGDDTGDNISQKNPNFCELTALYWIWKNDKDSDIIGLCHYRRYFDFNPSFFQESNKEIESSDPKKGLDYIFNDKNIKVKIVDLLDKYDAIVPKKKIM